MSEPQPGKELVKADEPKEPQPTGRAFKLPTWERWVAGGLGTAGGFAGIWAIIVSGKDGAGSVALIVASIVFWIIALVGVIPYKLWGKDMGYELGEIEGARKVAEAMADEVGSARMQEIVNETLNLQEIPAGLGTADLRSVRAGLTSAQRDLEHFVHLCDTAIQFAIDELGDKFGTVVLSRVSDAVDSDRLIHTSFGDIRVIYKRSLSFGSLENIVARFASGAEGDDVQIMIITKTPSMSMSLSPNAIRGDAVRWVDVVSLSTNWRLHKERLESALSVLQKRTRRK